MTSKEYLRYSTVFLRFSCCFRLFVAPFGLVVSRPTFLEVKQWAVSLGSYIKEHSYLQERIAAVF